MNQQDMSLFELNSMIKEVLNNKLPHTYKVVAEIAELSTNRTGHCYLTLVEKAEKSDNLVAQARATIWASKFRTLKPYFETTTGRSLEKGIKVLISVQVIFHETYGFSLNVTDIDPSFTLGDIERRRREIIDRLKQDGVYDDNRTLEMSFYPKNVAVVSSPTAAGYGDFLNQLENNTSEFVFEHKLFPAIMQGDKATDSIIEALFAIEEYSDLFDVVVLIRGGGSSTDLSCFDTYELAQAMTQFSLPIIAGIGHERDVTIADSVAHTRVKTPTAAATYLIDKFTEIELFITDRESRFLESVQALVEGNKENIRHISEVFAPKVKALLHQETGKQNVLKTNLRMASRALLRDNKTKSLRLADMMDTAVHHKIARHRDKLKDVPSRIKRNVSYSFKSSNMHLERYESVVNLSNPDNLLKKGYSLTYVDGVLLKDINSLKEGQEISSKLLGGEIRSTINKIIKK